MKIPGFVTRMTGEGLVLFPALTAGEQVGVGVVKTEQTVCGYHFCHIKEWHYSNHARKEGRAVFSFEAQNTLPCFVEIFFPPFPEQHVSVVAHGTMAAFRDQSGSVSSPAGHRIF